MNLVIFSSIIILAKLDLPNVLYHDNTMSLSYLIESEDERLINSFSITK